MNDINVPRPTRNRLPGYVAYLRTIDCSSGQYVSAKGIGQALGLNEVQVRKDLAMITSCGRPKVGYPVTELMADLRSYLGYDKKKKAAVVGAGNIGRAMLSFDGFDFYGLDIVATFDNDPALIGTTVGGKPVYSTSDMEGICRSSNIKLAIISLPESAAQETCDRLVTCGVTAIWNFAPVNVTAPEGVMVKNENLSFSIALFAQHIHENHQ